MTAALPSLLLLACETFEAASIKVNHSGLGGGYPELAPGGKRFSASNQLVLELLMFAYGVPPRQISGIPGGLSGERYDITGICGEPMEKDRLPGMMRALLAERFQLSVHRELRNQAIYALILEKGGHRLREASQPGGKPGLKQRGQSFTFTNAEMADLTAVLSQVSGRTVVDHTGLRGQFDFTLRYGQDGSPDSVFTALREQLGLRLEAQKDRVEFIVVDRLERPTGN